VAPPRGIAAKQYADAPIYLDGVQVAQGQIALSRGNALPVEIGRNGAGAGKYFQGKIDDVRIWSVARSGAEIAAHYRQQLASAPAGLVANWKLDEPTGTLAADSAAAHDARVTGGAAFVALVR